MEWSQWECVCSLFYCGIKSTFIILVIKSKTFSAHFVCWNISTIPGECKLKCYRWDTKCKNHLKKVFKKTRRWKKTRRNAIKLNADPGVLLKNSFKINHSNIPRLIALLIYDLGYLWCKPIQPDELRRHTHANNDVWKMPCSTRFVWKS